MKKVIAVLAVAGAAAFMASDAQAQVSDNNWIQVNATVQGIFDFKIDGNDYPLATAPAVYSFGQVSADGSFGTPTSVDMTAGSATYRAEPAYAWTVLSAPKRTVDISYQNASVTGPATGTMGLGQLSIEMSITQQASGTAGTSQGWTALSAAKTLLVNDVQTGNGVNTAAGNVNLELVVDSDDAAGVHTYTVELIAEGV